MQAKHGIYIRMDKLKAHYKIYKNLII